MHDSDLLLGSCLPPPQLLKLFVFLRMLLLQQRNKICLLLSLSLILTLQLPVELIDNPLNSKLATCNFLLQLLPLDADLLYSRLLP